MSEIDVFAHEIYGTLAGVPLYRITEESDRALATPSQFLLGGGSGEHNPCIIDVVGAVTFFMLDDELEEVRWDLPCVPEFPFSRIEALLKALDPVDVRRDATDQWYWGGDDYVRFVKRAKRAEGFGRPYEPKRDGSIENWTLSSVGEYALVARTDLVTELIGDRVAPEVVTELQAFARAVASAPVYLNVMAFPTGYEHVGGRRTRLGDGNVVH